MNARKQLSAEQRRALLATPAGWLACGFGSGLTPLAQGTFGSLAALLPWLWLRELPLGIYLIVLLVGFVIGVWACDVAGRALGVDDHRSLVWDEFIGQWVALIPLLLPALLPASGFHWWMLVLGFVLFRLFDVWKPWPIRYLDRHLKGGTGVMVDDVVAGIFAGLVIGLGLQLLR
ncbi:phosphatidylglycerophosphatase A [Rhodanobacter sp. B05]|uniref:phosphatidylglycerophosphatase A family protein n=1 Tax=Rhodanobacter sp. B05 TaxID=1945859 RepID=UPI0009871656|nr:phosphatidylglycerophosphatase A [Rhodanobacter sp. B05]OOG59107.1 phosphatidylglycerophosphatase A [Rhodanobacter sp. B05]